MYILNQEYLKKIIKQKGYSGLKPLLEELGLHRNSLNRYIKGVSILPKTIETVFSKLDIPIEKGTKKIEMNTELPIDPLVSEIHNKFPHISIFMFGSRVKGNARKNSDYDIGLYSRDEIKFADFLDVLEIKEQFEENSPVKVDCTNLTNADKDFISGIMPNIRMLAGYERDYNHLRKLNHEQ